jgi:hypothetical protein
MRRSPAAGGPYLPRPLRHGFGRPTVVGGIRFGMRPEPVEALRHRAERQLRVLDARPDLVVGRTEETDWRDRPLPTVCISIGAESRRDRPTSNEPQLTGRRRRMQGFISAKPILRARSSASG